MELLQHLGLERRPEWLPEQVVLLGVPLLLASVMVAAARLTAAIIKGAARWLRVAWGCRGVPAAPGGGLLGLGHTLQLALAPCPWEKMLEWARASGTLTRFNILQRTGLIVNDPEGAKRVFQVRCSCGGGRPAAPTNPAVATETKAARTANRRRRSRPPWGIVAAGPHVAPARPAAARRPTARPAAVPTGPPPPARCGRAAAAPAALPRGWCWRPAPREFALAASCPCLRRRGSGCMRRTWTFLTSPSSRFLAPAW